MMWSRAENFALASRECRICQGSGGVKSYSHSKPTTRAEALEAGRQAYADAVNGNADQALKPCHCVLRAVFRACLSRWRHCGTAAWNTQCTQWDRVGGFGRSRGVSQGRRNEEYICDFWLIAHRVLPAESFQIFKFHFLLGADWKLCCRRLGINRGTFFHHVYRIEQLLGRAYREMQPYALYPLEEYFGPYSHGPKPPSVPPTDGGSPCALRPPLMIPVPAAEAIAA